MKENPEAVRAELKRRGFPGWRTMSRAQRYNAKMEQMFEFARRVQGEDYGEGFGGREEKPEPMPDGLDCPVAPI